MVAVLTVLVARVEGLVVAAVVVVKDPFLEVERRVAVEEVGVLMLEIRTRTSARVAGTNAIVVMLMLLLVPYLEGLENLESI